MGKKAWLAGGAGLAALLAGGSCFFYEVAIPRKSKIRLPEKDSDGSKRKEIERRIEGAGRWIEEQHPEKLMLASYDGLRLNAKLILAEERTEKTILAVHGYRSSGAQDFGAMLPFYHELGYNVLLMDDRGHGESEGDYVGYGWQDHFDCRKWIDYLALRFGDKAEIFLHGVSMGAATVMITAGEELPEQVKGIISDCGYTSAVDQFKYVLKKYYHLPSFPLLPMTRQLTKLRAGYDFADCDARKALKKATLPILFIHGDQDDFVPTAMGYENYESCASEDKELVLIEGAGHAQSYYVNTEGYETAVREFLEKWSEKW